MSILILFTLLDIDVDFDSNLLIFFLFSSISVSLVLITSIVLDNSIISCLIDSKEMGSNFNVDMISDNSNISNFIVDMSFLFALISSDRFMFILFILSFRLLTSVFILIVAFSIDAILSVAEFIVSILLLMSVNIFLISV